MIQGFSGGLLNRELIYQTDLPSFQRDFASLKTLDHGTGPAITFTRASDATYFDADGVLQTAANDTPRFDHDPATGGSSLGLLIEEARTNSIRNAQAGGSTNGVIGSGGVMPTNWSITANANGVTSEIIGTGTETGLAYIDIKISGTPTGTGSVFINFDGATAITAATGQTWTTSAYAKLAAGAVTNATCSLNIRGLDAAGVQVGTSTTTNFTPTSSGLNTQRSSVARALADAGVERVQGRALVAYTSGDPIDLTLRIAAPQLEQGAFPTSYIPTTTAAATRSADVAYITPISSFYNSVEGTLFLEHAPLYGSEADLGIGVISFGTSSAEILSIQGDGRAIATSSSATQASLETGGFATRGAVTKRIFSYKENDFAATGNLLLPTINTDTSGVVPTGLGELRFARAASRTPTVSNHIRKIAYWPKRLTNTLLEQLTT